MNSLGGHIGDINGNMMQLVWQHKCSGVKWTIFPSLDSFMNVSPLGTCYPQKWVENWFCYMSVYLVLASYRVVFRRLYEEILLKVVALLLAIGKSWVQHYCLWVVWCKGLSGSQCSLADPSLFIPIGSSLDFSLLLEGNFETPVLETCYSEHKGMFELIGFFSEGLRCNLRYFPFVYPWKSIAQKKFNVYLWF